MKAKNKIAPIIKRTDFGLAKFIVNPIDGILLGGVILFSSGLK
ncbi:hypothetical protein [Flavobacterium gawalongense]|nr:hypothetical protein [Flavobacterium gawalongense]